ncbi:hypothetical protein HU200_024890 [Digitaria exilis]|uniref:Uncharacterized protein n=1 Tax=Digitaria exilis TaxID=1010633 RepID=A0A835EWD4_9POAL|nr:hypothetical protein HU200_024890 [Digitaria exilis]
MVSKPSVLADVAPCQPYVAPSHPGWDFDVAIDCLCGRRPRCSQLGPTYQLGPTCQSVWLINGPPRPSSLPSPSTPLVRTQGQFARFGGMASSVSLNASRPSWSVDGERRQGPLDYESTVFYHCGNKVALWISWSNDNPGRRYLNCYKARVSPVDGFVHSLLVDLHDTVWALKREKTELKAALGDAVLKLEQQRKEIRSLSKSQKSGMKREFVKEEMGEQELLVKEDLEQWFEQQL